MSSETVLLSVSLALAFGGVPLATLIHAHIITTRAVRHVAEIKSLAASASDARRRQAEDISRLGVLELQAMAMAAAEELNERSDGRARGAFRMRGEHRRDRQDGPNQKVA